MDRPEFIKRLIARLLVHDGFDPSAADIVAEGLRNNRDGYVAPAGGLQHPDTFYPGLTSRAWHDVSSFPWIPALEAATPDILNECLALQKEGHFHAEAASLGLTDGVWEQFPLYMQGRQHRGNAMLCPRTIASIENIPGATSAGLVYFSLIGPHSHVKPHCGPHNARLRCHLGVIVPEGARLRVGDETRSWEAGKAIIFDDSFEHEVWNDAPAARIVLIMDLWHPELTPGQIAALRHSESPAVTEAFDVALDLWRSRVPA